MTMSGIRGAGASMGADITKGDGATGGGEPPITVGGAAIIADRVRLADVLEAIFRWRRSIGVSRFIDFPAAKIRVFLTFDILEDLSNLHMACTRQTPKGKRNPARVVVLVEKEISTISATKMKPIIIISI